MYFGGKGMATTDIFSCDTQSDRFGGNTGRFSPSTKHVLAGPCLCVNVEVLGRNVSRLSESLQPNNSRLVILASFYDGEIRRSANKNQSGAGGKHAVEVAYTCSSSERPVTPLVEPNSTISTSLNNNTEMATNNDSTVRNRTVYPLNVTHSGDYGVTDSDSNGVTDSDNHGTKDSDNEKATGSDNYLANATGESVSETTSPPCQSPTWKTGGGNGEDTVWCPDCREGTGKAASGIDSSLHSTVHSTDHMDLTGKNRQTNE